MSTFGLKSHLNCLYSSTIVNVFRFFKTKFLQQSKWGRAFQSLIIRFYNYFILCTTILCRKKRFICKYLLMEIQRRLCFTHWRKLYRLFNNYSQRNTCVLNFQKEIFKYQSSSLRHIRAEVNRTAILKDVGRIYNSLLYVNILYIGGIASLISSLDQRRAPFCFASPEVVWRLVSKPVDLNLI